MYKLLIVDDEPLVQVGIKSMLNWSELNIEVAGTAGNGQMALQFIAEKSPDIVITDIKMPVMSGLELIRTCREAYGERCPHFVILTSYEDFHMLKEAVAYQVTDYLIKLELTPDSLKETMSRIVTALQKANDNRQSGESDLYPFYDKFLIRLLNNLFDTEEQFLLQSRDLKLNFQYEGYLCCYGEMVSPQADGLPVEKQLSLYAATIQMLRELAAKYCPCYCISLDIRHFAIIFCYEEIQGNRQGSEQKKILESINDTIYNYYSVSFRCGIGNMVRHPLAVCDSFQHARQLFQLTGNDSRVVCADMNAQIDSVHSSFNIGLFKRDLTRAFEEYNSEILGKTLDELCELFLSHPNRYIQAMDAACNILFLSITLIQNGEQIISELFRDTPGGYRSIYMQTSTEQVVNWLMCFRKKICGMFEEHKKDYKNRIVINVKQYINEHITQRISLNEVAAIFGISPNYLSQLFGKYSEVGFSEYVNISKIKEARRLLEEENLKIYEAAEILGFESSFYFSKVFKRVEGISPTDYLKNKC